MCSSASGVTGVTLKVGGDMGITGNGDTWQSWKANDS